MHRGAAPDGVSLLSCQRTSPDRSTPNRPLARAGGPRPHRQAGQPASRGPSRVGDPQPEGGHSRQRPPDTGPDAVLAIRDTAAPSDPLRIRQWGAPCSGTRRAPTRGLCDTERLGVQNAPIDVPLRAGPSPVERRDYGAPRSSGLAGHV